MANLSNINGYFNVTDTGLVNVVNGGLYVTKSSGDAIVGIISSGGSGKPYYLRSNTSGNFAIYDDIACLERLTILSGGNVGIGTPSPTNAKLVISDTGSNKISIDGGTSQNGMRWEAVGGANGFYLFNGTFGTAGFGLYNINTTQAPLWIQNGGNVGIGTTSPLHNLQIGTEGTNGSYSMMIEGNFANTALSSNPRLNLIDTNFGITAGKYGSGGADDALGIFAYQGTGRGILFAHTTAGATTTLQNMRHDMFVDGGTGNVGIGTTSPGRKLQVEGGDFYTNDKSDTAGASVGYGGNSFQIRNGSTSEDLNFDIFNRTTSAWGTPLIIKNTGNVGIGTTSPGFALDVESSTTPLHLNRTGGSTALIGLDIAGTNRGLIGATTTAAFVSYSTAAAPLMTIP
jgi:hypothetical protein